ncbi:unnamed protein product [Polarella glacialis]|uniref:Uncharacterized protein n=1 Tax=Polarella glacialis TaxID=89957 RepID=A0A813HY88_POLGL|nr:unnamed protein product [Polarella glacialis]
MVSEAEELVSHSHLGALDKDLESHEDSTSVPSQPVKTSRAQDKSSSICEHIGQVLADSCSRDAAAAVMSEAAPQSAPVILRTMLPQRDTYNLDKEMQQVNAAAEAEQKSAHKMKLDKKRVAEAYEAQKITDELWRQKRLKDLSIINKYNQNNNNNNNNNKHNINFQYKNNDEHNSKAGDQ